MQFSKVPYKMTSCLVDNCRWLYLRNLFPFYLDLWPRPRPVGLPYHKPQQRFAVHKYQPTVGHMAAVITSMNVRIKKLSLSGLELGIWNSECQPLVNPQNSRSCSKIAKIRGCQTLLSENSADARHLTQAGKRDATRVAFSLALRVSFFLLLWKVTAS